MDTWYLFYLLRRSRLCCTSMDYIFWYPNQPSDSWNRAILRYQKTTRYSSWCTYVVR